MTTGGARPRVAIVTGGARGIGQATAVRLAADGCAVVIADVLDAGAAVAGEIVAGGGRARFIETDVADRGSVAALVDATEKTFGTVDALAAVAGILGDEHEVAGVPEAEWNRVLAINLNGVLHCCQAVLPGMAGQGWGRIVAVTSYSRNGSPQYAPYAVSKAGVVALIASIAHGYARSGVLANCLQPGRAITDMITARFDEEHLADPPGVAIGRYAQPEEMAEVIAFLCSERNTYAVGAVWDSSGGV